MSESADYSDRLKDYVDVATRLRELRRRWPAASLRPVDLEHPFRVVAIGERTFIAYTAGCYRWPGDTDPGIGSAWEPYPGTTPYTRNSELQNAETSAWGRAIVAALAADTKAGVASRDEMTGRDEVPPLSLEPSPEMKEATTALQARVNELTPPEREQYDTEVAGRHLPWPPTRAAHLTAYQSIVEKLEQARGAAR